ncbi:hypothetical protein [Microbacterium sp. USHLN186]|uniref:hypothetical protein n=1 Tax=Microbacterium sp. USHLN186 TaxID=3081286 RepID=UPI003018A27F
MTQRTTRCMLVVLALLSLCGCAAAGDSETTAASTRASLQLALSTTCDDASDPHCIPVGSERVLLPSTFENAAVENAVARSDSVDVTFTDNGAEVLNDLTAQASGAGAEFRLLVKVGHEIIAAVSVMEPLNGDHVTLGLTQKHDPETVVALIQGS